MTCVDYQDIKFPSYQDNMSSLKKQGDDDDDETSFKDWVLEKLDEMFVKSLPMDAIRDLPPVYMYVVGVVVQIVALYLFVVFIIQGYNQGVSQQYISLQSNNGVCETVPAPITGTFLADTSGNWQSSSLFDYTKASYLFQFQDLRLDASSYSAMIYNVKNKLEPYALLSQTSNLGLNLLLWMVMNEFFSSSGSQQYTPSGTIDSDGDSDGTATQIFALTGEPQYVFNRQYIVGSMLNQTGRCDLVGATSMEPTAALLSISYSYDSYVAQGCADLMDPAYLGYDELQSGGELKLTVNMNSLVVAAGVNAGTYANVHLMKVFGAPVSYVDFEGVRYEVAEYTDIIYTVSCPRNNAIAHKCGH